MRASFEVGNFSDLARRLYPCQNGEKTCTTDTVESSKKEISNIHYQRINGPIPFELFGLIRPQQLMFFFI